MLYWYIFVCINCVILGYQNESLWTERGTYTIRYTGSCVLTNSSIISNNYNLISWQISIYYNLVLKHFNYHIRNLKFPWLHKLQCLKIESKALSEKIGYKAKQYSKHTMRKSQINQPYKKNSIWRVLLRFIRLCGLRNLSS